MPPRHHEAAGAKGKGKGKAKGKEKGNKGKGKKGAAESITSQAAHSNPGAERARNDPDAEKVYCFIPWVMKDYPNGSYYPIRQDIDDMDCYMKFQTYRQCEVSRITIWGRNALEAWHHFLGKTKEVLPEKMSLYVLCHG